MHTAIGPLRVESPGTLDAALSFLGDHAGEAWIPLAGGTDLLVLINNGASPGTRYLDLWPLRESLSGVSFDGSRWRVGAMTTMTRLRGACASDGRLPRLIAEAASVVGGIQIQNRATVGGNIANASPAGDTLPVWAVLEAELALRSARGERCVPYRAFHLGYRELDRRPDELLVELRFSPLPDGARTFFHKVGTRAAQAISKVVLAGAIRIAEGRFAEVRLAAGSLAPVPVRLGGIEERLRGEVVSASSVEAALGALEEDVAPIDDIRSTREYRLEAARNLLRHYLLQAS